MTFSESHNHKLLSTFLLQLFSYHIPGIFQSKYLFKKISLNGALGLAEDKEKASFNYSNYNNSEKEQ